MSLLHRDGTCDANSSMCTYNPDGRLKTVCDAYPHESFCPAFMRQGARCVPSCYSTPVGHRGGCDAMTLAQCERKPDNDAPLADRQRFASECIEAEPGTGSDPKKCYVGKSDPCEILQSGEDYFPLACDKKACCPGNKSSAPAPHPHPPAPTHKKTQPPAPPAPAPKKPIHHSSFCVIS